MSTTKHVPEADMPQLFQAADEASKNGQADYLRGTRLRLGFLVFAAAAGITSWRVGDQKIDVLATLACVAFLVTLYVEVSLWRARPDRTWYDGRAVAESAKTLAWKYAVCANPFPLSVPTRTADVELVDRLGVVGDQFASLELEPIDAPMISAWMKEQRESSLADRQQTYLDARIADQKRWYARESRFNKRRSNQWRILLTISELTGAVLSLIEMFHDTGLLIPPILASLVGAAAAWLETKQHDSLARAYAAAVTDLARAEVKLNAVSTEESWAQEVDDAEEAISREHVVWLASRSRI